MPRHSLLSLHRYPVKSMQGERIDESYIDVRGIVGDRGYAILEHATGHIASAKHPGKWARLLECRATFQEQPRIGRPLPPVRIALPDGSAVSSNDSDIDNRLSAMLGRDVSLIHKAPVRPMREADRTDPESDIGEHSIREEAMGLAAPSGTFFDYAPIHLITTGTLEHFGEITPESRFDYRRFRPNIVVAVDAATGAVENQWPGQRIRIGEQVVLDVIDPTPRCIITTLAQGDLPDDREILRTIARHGAAISRNAAPGLLLRSVAGVYATAAHSGSIREGDALRILD